MANEGRLNLPFVGLVSFMRSPVCTDLSRIDGDIAILGAPTDEGTPWAPGSRFAPRKIREMSVRYAGFGPVQKQTGYYDIEEDRRYLEYERAHQRIVDCGDSDIIYTNVKRTFDNITKDVKTILKAGAFPVVIGGDHAITYPVVRAYEERLNVVHFDAHPDYRRRGHQAIVDRLPKGEPVYVSIDIDVLDLPLVPGCASSEVNGLTYDELRDSLFAIARHTEVIGFDLVEVNPMLDVASENTSLIAAQLIMEFLGRIVEHPQYRRRHPARPGGPPAGRPPR